MALSNSGAVIARLEDVIRSRIREGAADSYVAGLAENHDRLLKKIGEEATEVILAAKQPRKAPIVEETADLVFHLLVLLGLRGIAFDDVMAVLAGREGVSGLQEKQLRTPDKSR